MKILDRKIDPLSRWTSLVTKTIQLPGKPEPEHFHSLQQCDYIGVIARTVSGKYPLVRQFRQAVEDYTIEFVAGLKDSQESVEEICRSELREEAGVELVELISLGTFYADSGRLGNKVHMFFARTSDPNPNLSIEAGLQMELATLDEIHEYIKNGKFSHQPHLGMMYLAQMRGLLD